MKQLSLALVTLAAATMFACGSAEEGSSEGVSVLETFETTLPVQQPEENAAPTEGDDIGSQPLAFAAEGAKETVVAPKRYRGINIAGAEFGAPLPGIEGRDYYFATPSQLDYYLGKGMNTFRLGFKWERLQPTALGALNETYLGKLDVLVTYATSKGATVILNPHNFARYYGVTVGSSGVPANVFANLWSRLAEKYKTNANVIFNLVNEPNNIVTEQWVTAANAAIAAIRTAGATNVIHVPGNSWTGAHSWYGPGYGTSNAVAMLDITDPIDNVVFEVHQYMDATSGGTSDQCVSATIGAERLVKFVGWLRANKKKGFVGEFAGGRNAACNTAVTNMLKYMEDNGDVLEGWLWWAGGPAWGEYPFTLEPKGGVDRPQMALLTPFLGK